MTFKYQTFPDIQNNEKHILLPRKQSSMPSARTPTAQLSDCADELESKDIELEINRTEENLFYVNPEKSVWSKDYLKGFVQESAHSHNLYFFAHEDKWIVSTLPEEQSDSNLF